MKIKDNLDLSGYILQNFCVDNFDDLQKASKGVGRMLFFTGNSSDDRYGHVNVYDGDEFKALAYVDDVANNEAFQALEERVKLLAGDVDTDSLINNLKDLEEFLKGYDETDKLQSLLDGKVDKVGGVMSNPYGSVALTINSDAGADTASAGVYIAIQHKGTKVGEVGHGWGLGTYISANGHNLGIKNDGTAYVGSHSILTSAGGTIRNSGAYLLEIDRTDGKPAILFSHNGTPLGYLGYDTEGNPIAHINSVSNILLHSGNVGDYTAGAAKSIVDASENALVTSDSSNLFLGTSSAAGLSTFVTGKDIRFRAGSSYATAMLINSSGNATIGSQDLAGTNAKLYVDGDILLKSTAKIGAEYNNTKRTYNYIEFNSGSNGIRYYGGTWTSSAEIAHQFLVNPRFEAALTMMNSGNVLIGTTTDNGAKLQVNGGMSLSAGASMYDKLIRFVNNGANVGFISSNANGEVGLYGKGAIYLRPFQESLDASSPYGMKLTKDETTINGDLRVTGNIIAEKEVSAGGAGEEGSGGSSSGSGAFYSETIAVSTSSKSIAHGLGTEDIVVSIYEKNNASGKWEMVLTDIEISDANNVLVTFGSATDVEHKVVIMGAVA